MSRFFQVTLDSKCGGSLRGHHIFFGGFTDKFGLGMLLQFSVTEHFKGGQPGQGRSLPGVFFFYDLSPIKVGPVIFRYLIFLKM